MDATGVVEEPSQPVPRTFSRNRPVAEVRLPLAGPYRPRARLYRISDGRLLWTVRLWDVDRATTRVVSTDTLRRFARLNRLPGLEAELDAAVRAALAGRKR